MASIHCARRPCGDRSFPVDQFGRHVTSRHLCLRTDHFADPMDAKRDRWKDIRAALRSRPARNRPPLDSLTPEYRPLVLSDPGNDLACGIRMALDGRRLLSSRSIIAVALQYPGIFRTRWGIR